MPKKSRQKFKKSWERKELLDQIKSNFHHFWGAIIEANNFFGRWEFDFNNTEYDWIYRHIPGKNSAEYAWILNVSDAVHNITVQITEQLSRQRYSEHCQTFKMECFSKKNNAWGQMCNQKLFRTGGGRFVKLGHFDKHFIKNTRKRGPTRKHFLEIFLLGTRKTTFWIENLTQRWTQSGPFFPKSEHIFKFQKG